MTFSAVETIVDGEQARRIAQRRTTERVLAFAALLPADERGLVEAVYRDGRSTTDIARAVGACPRRYQRKLNGILRRMRDPRFRFVAEGAERLPPETRAVARRVVLQGMSQRQAATATGKSLHQVRMALQTVRTLCDADSAPPADRGRRHLA